VTRIPFFLDFVSPYTWLALMRAGEFEREHACRFDPRPIVYAKLLEAHGLLGPVETPAKRRYTFHDVARLAGRSGLRLTGPPEHPFRSLTALRVATLFRDDPRALSLCAAISAAAWSRGADLTQIDVLAGIVSDAGFDARDLPLRSAAPQVKEALRSSTAEAVAEGVFGVPSFAHEGRLFWGHDRMDQLAESLAGRIAKHVAGDAERMLARPIGVVRPRPGEPAS